MWIELEEQKQKQIFEQVGNAMGLPAFVIEKDAWVCLLLKAVFQSKFTDAIIFKGGTSLSKAYHIINRFSEDIDLIIDRELLGFGKLTSKTQIKKLRKASGGFIINEFREELIAQLDDLGVERELYEIRYNEEVNDMSDPNTLEIYYNSLFPISDSYIQQRVLLEMGARSLTEPMENKPIISFVDSHFKDLSFVMPSFDVQVVIPTRTFIEKVLLLHEEFLKPIERIRTDRLTRHLYDLDKIMRSEYGELAIKDEELFQTIVEHRASITPIRGIDYSNHKKGSLRIIPPMEVLSDWKKDYKAMQENMIIGESLDWKNLLKSIQHIEDHFNNKL